MQKHSNGQNLHKKVNVGHPNLSHCRRLRLTSRLSVFYPQNNDEIAFFELAISTKCHKNDLNIENYSNAHKPVLWTIRTFTGTLDLAHGLHMISCKLWIATTCHPWTYVPGVSSGRKISKQPEQSEQGSTCDGTSSISFRNLSTMTIYV